MRPSRKPAEHRVAMTPVGVEELMRGKNKVLIEAGAGSGSGISDEQYSVCGAEIVPDGATIWNRSDLIGAAL